MTRRGLRGIPGRGRVGRGGVALAVGVLTAITLGGCGDDDPPQASDPTSPATTADPTASASASSDPATSPADGATDDAVPSEEQCAAITEADTALAQAVSDELARLEVDTNSPEATLVTLVATSRNAPAYWESIAAAVPQPLRADADRISAYWARIGERVGDIEIADGSRTAIDAAATELTEATADLDQDPEVLDLQNTVREQLAAGCAEPVPDPSAS